MERRFFSFLKKEADHVFGRGAKIEKAQEMEEKKKKPLDPKRRYV